MRYLIIICIAFALFACEKKELPAPKYDRGDVITTQINMSSNYKYQIWFSLSENKIISTNNRTDWDIAFESSALGTHVVLNTSLSMRLYKTNYTQLSEVTDTLGLGANEKVDSPTGNLDSTAIGNWQANNVVYIINRGYSETGGVLGYYKLKLKSVSATNYSFEYGDVFGTQVYQGTIAKNDMSNFSYYSFNSHQQVSIEPAKTDYDMCFTQYTHLFNEPPYFYQVTGVVNNYANTRVTVVLDRPFNDISLNDTLGRTFKTSRNTIGYEWKTFSLNTNLYVINSAMCYIIHDSKGFYYKLHFIDFYNTGGIKGYPTFEFKKL